MRQDLIMELLVEASELAEDSSDKERNERRLGEISSDLIVACAEQHTNDFYQEVVLKVFIGTLEGNPERLPTLFPFFAMFCGDHSTDGAIEVNWNLRAPPVELVGMVRCIFSKLPVGSIFTSRGQTSRSQPYRKEFDGRIVPVVGVSLAEASKAYRDDGPYEVLHSACIVSVIDMPRS